MVSTRLKFLALFSFIAAMGVLLIGGYVSRGDVAPYPDKLVVKGEGTELVDGSAIRRGQMVFQKYGLMDHGSVWGHGSLRGMDFSATTLHLIGQHMREYYAEYLFRTPFAQLPERDKDNLNAIVIRNIKSNNFDPATGVLSLTPAQAYAYEKLADFWDALFRDGDTDYGFLPNTVRAPEERADLAAFFFWTAWASGANRPGLDYSYTNNWPHDPSVGNLLTVDAIIWSVLAIAALLVVLGFVIFVVHRYGFFYGEPKLGEMADVLAHSPISVSQRKAAKFFLVVGLLFILQINMGGLLAHYTVHPGTFYFKFVSDLVPYSWAKSWHLQLGILWIATAWVGSALYIAPLVGGREPKGQGVLVDVLFVAVVAVALGSLLGEALGIRGVLDTAWYWLGHQGWEYLELGRLWQILLFGGLLAWLFIAYRALADRLKREGGYSGLTHLYVYAAILVVVFFGFGLFYNRSTHFTIADYWRWFVVHIWVEGMFEFFAAAATALLLVALGLVSKPAALRAAYLTAILVFCSGIIGTSHHFFWFGQPSFWLGLGAIFSSLEPIPLILLVVRAWMEHRPLRAAGTQYPYRWPMLFLTASAFWNFLGAGVFGFIINTPIINYFEHGTYLTSNHGHTALFGTYGMLAIALLLFSWRALVKPEAWREGWLRVSFWGLNIGLLMMSFLALFPIGVAQLRESFTKGFWFARSAEFYNLPIIQTLGQYRIVPDLVIILFGALPLLVFLLISFVHLKPATVKGGEPIFPEGTEELKL
ncbi:MAG: nitric-oxide reductase large subunit [Candidatus Abyssubacteria bacterium]